MTSLAVALVNSLWLPLGILKYNTSSSPSPTLNVVINGTIVGCMKALVISAKFGLPGHGMGFGCAAAGTASSESPATFSAGGAVDNILTG